MEVGPARVNGASRSRGRIGLILPLLVWLAACAKAPSALPPEPVGGYPLREARGDIHLAVDPFFTQERTRDAFTGGEEFPARGLLPVRVRVENRSSGVIRVDPRNATLIGGRWGQAPSLGTDEAFAMVKLPVGWWALGAGYVGGSAQAYRNEARRRDIEGRALAAQAVPPGGSASGFLYFSIPETEMNLAGSRLRLSVEGASGREVAFEFMLEGRRDLAAPGRAPDPAHPDKAVARPGKTVGTGGRGVIIRSPAQ